MRAAITASLLLAAACAVQVDQELPEGAQLSCTSAGDCPSDMTCDTGSGRCITPGITDNGGACTDSIQCVSGYCANGYCCASGICCNGSSTTCPAPWTACSACTATLVTYTCNASTFVCSESGSAGNDALCDGDACAGSYCHPGSETWFSCPDVCSGGVCDPNCTDTGNPCTP